MLATLPNASSTQPSPVRERGSSRLGAVMRFRRKRDGVTAEARQWLRHGDHKSVEPATADKIPMLQSPQKFGMLKTPTGYTAVFAGDWIVTLDTGAVIALPERMFRQGFEAISG